MSEDPKQPFKTIFHFGNGTVLNVTPDHQNKANVRTKFWAKFKKKWAKKVNDTGHKV